MEKSEEIKTSQRKHISESLLLLKVVEMRTIAGVLGNNVIHFLSETGF